MNKSNFMAEAQQMQSFVIFIVESFACLLASCLQHACTFYVTKEVRDLRGGMWTVRQNRHMDSRTCTSVKYEAFFRLQV